MARSTRGKSPQPPAVSGPAKATRSKTKSASTSYKSDGVDDNDVFLLPGSDYVVMMLLTALGALVRVFRIYQPSSVVFDEVQYEALPRSITDRHARSETRID